MPRTTAIALIGVTALTITLTSCSSDSDESTTVTQTVTEEASLAPAADTPADSVPVETTEETPAEELLIPSGLEGMNGQLAYEQLQDAGFTNVVPTSVDPSRAMPILFNNWTVTSVEPGPGTTVAADSTIILNMTKE